MKLVLQIAFGVALGLILIPVSCVVCTSAGVGTLAVVAMPKVKEAAEKAKVKMEEEKKEQEEAEKKEKEDQAKKAQEPKKIEPPKPIEIKPVEKPIAPGKPPEPMPAIKPIPDGKEIPGKAKPVLDPLALDQLEKEYREAGRKSLDADKKDQFEEAKKWKKISLEKYAQWKKLKEEMGR